MGWRGGEEYSNSEKDGEESERQGRKSRRMEKKGEEGEEGMFKIAFWNVAGLSNKDRDFWKGLNGWEVMILMETWVDEKGWKKVRDKLPKGYKWEKQWVGKKNKKGRAM